MKKVNLYFDAATHTYTDEENNIYTSTTTLIGQFAPKFNKKYWSMYRALEESRYRVRPDNKLDKILVYSENELFDKWKPYDLDDLYNGVLPTDRSTETIKAEWQQLTDVSLDWGNEKHNYLEDCIDAFYEGTEKAKSGTVADYDPRTASFRLKIVKQDELDNSPLSKTHPAVYKMLLRLIKAGFTLYAEKRVYSYEHRVSGTIDVLAVRGKEFYIIDWKTNKGEIEFEPGYYKKVWNKDRTLKIKTKEFVYKDERFKHPISSIKYCKGNGYALQLSIYAYLCELWGFKCLGLVLCHIRHKETVKVNYKKTKYGKSRDGLDIKKKELKPRIYNKMPYFRNEAAALVNANRDTVVLKKGVAKITARRPISLKQ